MQQGKSWAGQGGEFMLRLASMGLGLNSLRLSHAKDKIGKIASEAQALEKVAENAPGRLLGASDKLVGLNDVRNFSPGLTQTASDTCGLHCAGSVLDELLPSRTSTNVEIFSKTVAEILEENGGRGLSSLDVAQVISRNGDDLFTNVERNVSADELVALLSRGQVIAHVNGDHFVRPLKVFEEQGVKWVRIYDPARGYYDQLLDSFITRTGANNQMVFILGP